MTISVGLLLPRALQNASAETQRQATFVVYASGSSTLTVLLTLGLLWGLGYEGTATSLAWVLPLQFVPLLELVVGRKPRLAAHSLMLMLLLFFEIAHDFGPDDGFSVVATVALPVAASSLLGKLPGAFTERS